MTRLPLTTRSIKIRLFLTCWLVFVLHFASDFVREHYLVASIVEDHSFRLDKYLGLHVDIARNPPKAKVQGAHHNANPGISMVAAIPYFVLRPIVDAIVERNLAQRHSTGDTTTVYNDPRPDRVAFYAKVRRLGLDVRVALVGAITMAFCMAPLTALSAVLLFDLLFRLGLRRAHALSLALLYAFGTPVFFRTAFLNQNLAVGVFAFAAFYLLWDPDDGNWLGVRWRYAIAGFFGGLCLLCDYSGAIALGLLGLYGWLRRRDAVELSSAFKETAWFAVGALPPVALLLFYQWASFGNAFYPPQHWMVPIELTNTGYQGVGVFRLELLRLLLLDSRYGLFVTAPVLMVGAGALFLKRERALIPRREIAFCLAFSILFVLFFSQVEYTTLQWVTGIRYLTPVIPFLFLPTAAVLLCIPRIFTYALALISFGISWSMAMVRSQGTVLDNVVHVAVEGFQLPWLNVLANTATQYAPWLRRDVSPLVLFVFLGSILAIIWTLRNPWRPLSALSDDDGAGPAGHGGS